MMKKTLSLFLILFLVCYLGTVVSAQGQITATLTEPMQESETPTKSISAPKSVHYVYHKVTMTIEAGMLPNEIYCTKEYATLPDGTVVYAQGSVLLRSTDYGYPSSDYDTGYYSGTLLAYMPYEY